MKSPFQTAEHRIYQLIFTFYVNMFNNDIFVTRLLRVSLQQSKYRCDINESIAQYRDSELCRISFLIIQLPVCRDSKF
jgi:hypothetical protein